MKFINISLRRINYHVWVISFRFLLFLDVCFLFWYEHPYKLLTAYHSVVILVDVFEYLFDAFDWFCRVLKEESYLLIGYVSRMVNVEIAEGLLEMLLGKVVFNFQTCHDELSQIDVARTIGVDHSH